MPLYRNLKLPLDTGKEIIDGWGRGVFHSSLMAEKNIEILEKMGKIARISSPPMEIFPGWKVRAGKLAKAEIVTAEEFIDTPDDELAKILKVKPDTITRYKTEVFSLLSIPKPKG
jgi:fructose 1,6-bisphosphatase